MRLNWTDDRGDVILSGLLQTVMFLLVVALLVYEIGAVLVNTVQLDAIVDDAATAAARTAAAGGSSLSVEQAVLTSLADETGVVLESVTHNADHAMVSVSRTPLFLFAGRIPSVEERFTAHATKTVLIN